MTDDDRGLPDPSTFRPAPVAGPACQGTTTAVPRRMDGLALGAFVGLGLPDGMLGTAWPAVRHSVGAPLGDLGLVLLAVTLGATASSAVAGRLLIRLGIGAMLAGAGLVAGVGAAGFSVSPTLGLLAAAAILFGISSGLLDSGLNTAVALGGRPRLLNLLHGAYGVGSSIGPLVVTAAIVVGSWRPAYWGLVLLDLGFALAWWRTRRAWPRPPDRSRPAGEVPHRATRRRAARAVAAGLVVFFLYTGLEVAAGQWAASFDRGPLHLGPTAAGFAVFGYWGALTVVRLSLAIPRRPVAPTTVVRVGTGLAALSAAVVWWGPGTVPTLLGMVALGGSLAGVFPALVALTPARLGTDAATRAIGWQIGAANVGGSGLSAVVGLILQSEGLGTFGLCLVAMAGALLVGVVALERWFPVKDMAS